MAPKRTEVERRFRTARQSGASAVTLGQGALAAISALSIVVTARFLGPDGRGEIAILQSLLGLSVALGIAGLPTLIVRSRVLVAANRSTAWLLAISLISTLLLAMILTLGYRKIGGSLPEFSPLALGVLIALGASFQVLGEAYAARLQGEQRFTRLAISRLCWSGGSMATVAAVAYFTRQPVAAVTAGVVVQITMLLAVVSINGHARRATRFCAYFVRSAVSKPWRSLRHYRRERGIVVALQSHISFLLLMLVYRADILILGLASSASQVGIYSVAYAGAEIAWMYANGHSVTLMAAVVQDEDACSRKRVLGHAVTKSLIAAAGICVAAVLVGFWGIPFLFGRDFEDSYFTFLAMVPGVLLFVAFKLKTTVLVARGRPVAVTKVAAVLLPVNVLGTFALAPSFGAIGAAVATSVTYGLGYVLMNRVQP